MNIIVIIICLLASLGTYAQETPDCQLLPNPRDVIVSVQGTFNRLYNDARVALDQADQRDRARIRAYDADIDFNERSDLRSRLYRQVNEINAQIRTRRSRGLDVAELERRRDVLVIERDRMDAELAPVWALRDRTIGYEINTIARGIPRHRRQVEALFRPFADFGRVRFIRDYSARRAFLNSTIEALNNIRFEEPGHRLPRELQERINSLKQTINSIITHYRCVKDLTIAQRTTGIEGEIETEDQAPAAGIEARRPSHELEHFFEGGRSFPLPYGQFREFIQPQ